MENNKVFGKVFMWMFIGLLITFLTGYVVSSNDNMLYNIFSGGTYFILIIIELVLVVYLSARIHKMQVTTARIVFILYSFVSGLTFGSIFIVFKPMADKKLFITPFFPSIGSHAYVLSRKFIHIGTINNMINIFLLLDFIFEIKYATGYPSIRHSTVD